MTGGFESLCACREELATFQSFLDRITCLPLNPLYQRQQSSRTTKTTPTIEPPPVAPSHFVVTLKPMKGAAETAKMNVTATVGSLRMQTARLFSISDVDRCRLIRAGRALLDDDQTLESVFGLGGGEAVTLHVLEKPMEKTVVANDKWGSLLDANSPFWTKLDALLANEGTVSDVVMRKTILERFRSSLDK